MLRKTIFIILFCIMFTGGCTEPIGGEYFFDLVHSLQDVIDKEDWESANLQLTDLKNSYKKNDWKLQLLGDESEYEGINEAISRLSAAIKSKDSNQALLELATIRAFLEEIYTM